MNALKLYSLLLATFSLIVSIYAKNSVEPSENGENGKASTFKFSAPDLHDDEQHSPWMPEQLRCDACQAITHQLFTKFQAFNDKMKSLKYNLPESEILNLFESTCENSKVWEGYGIKELKPSKTHRMVGHGIPDTKQPGVIAGGGKWPGRYGVKVVNKVHRLSGEGIAVQDEVGITAGGGKWPTRLQDMCDQYAGQLGELVIYDAYKKKPKSKRALEDYLCRGTGLQGYCMGVKDEL